jgi:hypothetical protein
MKLDENAIVFGKTLNTTYVLWRNNYPREKCDPRFKTRQHPEPTNYRYSGVHKD